MSPLNFSTRSVIYFTAGLPLGVMLCEGVGTVPTIIDMLILEPLFDLGHGDLIKPLWRSLVFDSMPLWVNGAVMQFWFNLPETICISLYAAASALLLATNFRPWAMALAIAYFVSSPWQMFRISAPALTEPTIDFWVSQILAGTICAVMIYFAFECAARRRSSQKSEETQRHSKMWVASLVAWSLFTMTTICFGAFTFTTA